METQEISNFVTATASSMPMPVSMPAISSASASYSEGVINKIDFKWTIERLAFFGNKGIWETLTSTEFSDHKFKLEIVEDKELVIRLIHSNLSSIPIGVDRRLQRKRPENFQWHQDG